MLKLCDINLAARDRLPPAYNDKSGIGVHYAAAFMKPMNGTLPDGSVVSCKRKGLKILLTVGNRKGEGLLRRLVDGPDPVAIFEAALHEAARSAGVEIKLTDSEVFIQIPQG